MIESRPMSSELLPFLDRRIPRYTSYPTAVQFGPQVDSATYEAWLAELADGLPLSVYLHVPFCAELCLYCGCHTTVARRYAPVAAYVDLLEREIALVGHHLAGRRKAVHIHWGGGTPTMLSSGDFARLTQALHRAFEIAQDSEIAIEIDPRTLTRELVTTLAELRSARAVPAAADNRAGRRRRRW